MQTDIIKSIRAELKKNSDEKTRESAQNFFKESVRFYGIKSAVVAAIARDHFRLIKKENKTGILALCEELLKSGYFEEAMIAYNWADRLSKSFEESDFAVLEGWLRNHVDNWAACDTLCNHSVGSFIDRFPQYVGRLKQWAKSDNRWVRRASAVSLILPARRGDFLKEVFEIADILLEDQDDLVRKGYGWMLKEASRVHQKEVFDYIVRHKALMPRTALRYAIEKMPENLRKRAMEKE